MRQLLHSCNSAQGEEVKVREEEKGLPIGPENLENQVFISDIHPRVAENTIRLSTEEIAAYVNEMKTRVTVDDADDRGKTIRVNMREILDYQVKAKKPDGYRRAEEHTHTRSAAVLVGVGFIVIALCTYLFF